MRNLLLAGATMLSLLSGGAWSAAPEVDLDSGASARSILVDRGQIARQGLIGKVVVDRNGDTIGTVTDVLMVSSGGAAERTGVACRIGCLARGIAGLTVGD